MSMGSWSLPLAGIPKGDEDTHMDTPQHITDHTMDYNGILSMLSV